jgi:hypothetical protein
MTTPDLSRARWRTSARSGGNGNCVQLAALPQFVAVRDSKHPDGAALIFTAQEWAGFAKAVKQGEV